MISLHRSCQILLEELEKLGIPVKPQLLKSIDSHPLPFEDPEMQGELLLTPFYNRALYYRLDYASEWIEKLLRKPSRPEWFVVDTCFEQLGNAGVDGLRVARSKTQALSFALEQMVDYRFFPINISVSSDDEDETIFEDDTGRIVRISKVKFQPIHPTHKATAKQKLEKLYWRDPVSRLRKRFKKLPGEGVLNTNHMEKYDHMYNPIQYSCNAIATPFRQFIEEVTGTEIKLSLAQELCVKFFHLESWNYLKRLEKDFAEYVQRPFALFTIKQTGESEILSFFENLGDGLLGFKDHIRTFEEKRFEVSNYHGPSIYTKSTEGGIAQKGQLILQVLQGISTQARYDADAAQLQNSSNFSNAILRYFSSTKSDKQRIVDVNAKSGTSQEEHFFYGDWFFWIDKSYKSTQYQYLVVERFNGNVSGKDKAIYVTRMKAAIVLNPEDNQYWMATDWDRKPTFSLADIPVTALAQIEEKFVSREVWLLAERTEANKHFYRGDWDEV